MLNALYNFPRSAVRALIIWALGREVSTYDPAALDEVIAETKGK
jgi:hypothetical protein